MSKYFSYIEPLSASERNSIDFIEPKVGNRRRRHSCTDIDVFKYPNIQNVLKRRNSVTSLPSINPPAKHPDKWQNSWKSKPTYFSVHPTSVLDNNIFRRKKKRMLVKDEKFALAIYKIIHIVDHHPIKYKWIKIVNKKMKRRMKEIDKIFEAVIKKFEGKEKDDLLWKNAKYSPSVLPPIKDNDNDNDNADKPDF